LIAFCLCAGRKHELPITRAKSWMADVLANQGMAGMEDERLLLQSRANHKEGCTRLKARGVMLAHLSKWHNNGAEEHVVGANDN